MWKAWNLMTSHDVPSYHVISIDLFAINLGKSAILRQAPAMASSCSGHVLALLAPEKQWSSKNSGRG